MPTGPIFREQNPTILKGKSGAEVKDFGGGGMSYANPLDNPNYKPPTDLNAIKTKLEGIKAGLAGLGTPAPTPAVGSAPAAAGVTAIGSDIANLTAQAGISDGQQKAYDEGQQLLTDRASALAARRAAEIQSINAGFDVTKRQTETQQGKETGGAGMFLARAGGGFAPSASGQGYMQNLAIAQREELFSLEAKRQSAIQQANSAYEDKDFDLARLKVEEARNFQKDITDAKNTAFSQNLQISQEKRAIAGDRRAQDEFTYRKVNDRMSQMLTQGITPTKDQLGQMAIEFGRPKEELQQIFEGASNTRKLKEEADRNTEARANRAEGRADKQLGLAQATFAENKKNQMTTTRLAILDRLMKLPVTEKVQIDGEWWQGMNDDSGTGEVSYTEKKDKLAATERVDLMADIEAGKKAGTPFDSTKALRVYPHLDSTEIERIYKLADKNDLTQLTDQEQQKFLTKEWDTVRVQDPNDAKKTVSAVVDVNSWTKILEEWAAKSTGTSWDTEGKAGGMNWWDTGGAEDTSDEDITFMGKTYTGPTGTRPDISQYLLPEITAKIKAKAIDQSIRP